MLVLDCIALQHSSRSTQCRCGITDAVLHADIPDVQVAIAQPLVPALALGMSAALGVEKLSYVSALGIVISVAGAVHNSDTVEVGSGSD
jgi:hypothetical protein